MAGETAKCEALCLAIHPWSRTSHVVLWLTERGPLKTVVKGAVRPKSAFLGQYDLNYTCEIVYYLHERGSLHALRECVPHSLRDGLRGSYRSLTLAGYVRFLLGELAAAGDESAEWYRLAGATLTKLENADRFRQLLEIMLQKLSPVLYRALGIYLPLITTNCAVLGAATINDESARSVLSSTLFGAFSGVGFALALVLFSSLREKFQIFQGMTGMVNGRSFRLRPESTERTSPDARSVLSAKPRNGSPIRIKKPQMCRFCLTRRG